MMQSLGAALGLWGVFWFLLDHNARAPGFLFAFGLFFLLTGVALGV